MVLKLKEIIQAFNNDKASVEEVLSDFEAVNTPSKEDVETFLKSKSYDMEVAGQAVTYLLLNDHALNNNQFIIDGYFTLAIKAFEFRSEISKHGRRRLTGKSDDFVPAYLIGQLAKSSSAGHGIGRELLAQAKSYIYSAIQTVGGRLIYLDCKDDLVSYYEKNGFSFLQKQEKNSLNQMYLII